MLSIFFPFYRSAISKLKCWAGNKILYLRRFLFRRVQTHNSRWGSMSAIDWALFQNSKLIGLAARALNITWLRQYASGINETLLEKNSILNYFELCEIQTHTNRWVNMLTIDWAPYQNFKLIGLAARVLNVTWPLVTWWNSLRAS